MSALGEYIHHSKINYNKYGLRRAYGKNPNDIHGSVITDQLRIWSNYVDSKTRQINQIAKQPDPVEEALQEQISTILKFMQDLTDGKSKNMPITRKKITDQLFEGAFRKYQKNLTADWASGQLINSNTEQNLFTTDNTDLIKRIAKTSPFRTKNRVLIKEGTPIHNKQELLALYQTTIRECSEMIQHLIKSKKGFFNYETGTISKAYKKLKDLLLEAARSVAAIKNSLNDLDVNIDNETGWMTFKGAEGLREAAQRLSIIINMLYIPTETVHALTGRMMELIVYYALQQGTDAAINVACDKFEGGAKKVKGGATVNIMKYAKKHLEKNKMTQLANMIEQTEMEDKVVSAVLNYEYESQVKSDCNFTYTFQENGQTKTENHGLSIKNYSELNREIHLVSESPLINFVLGWFGNQVDMINHMLNILSDDSPADVMFDGKEDASIKSQITNLSYLVNMAMKLNIFISAASGSHVGKTEGIADYLLVHGRKENDIKIISINKLVAKAMQNEAIVVRYSGATGKKAKAYNEGFVLDNTWVLSSSGNVYGAANERIARLIGQLHQIKISASVNFGKVFNLTT